jgi:chromosome segregation protein
VREVRRQMRPLERQAVSARSYSDVEVDLRAARRALFSSRLHTFDARRRALEGELAESATRERELRHELVTLDAQAASAAAEMASRREELLASTLGTLQGLAERARGTSSVIQERGRSLRQALVASADENVIATLEADAAKLTVDLASVDEENLTLSALREKVASAQDELDEAQRLFDDTWGSTSSEGDEATLIAARQRIALLERSLESLHESERRANLRLLDARAQITATTADHEALRRDRDLAHAALAGAVEERLAAVHDADEAEEERTSSDEALREATDWSARTQAHADALARALDEFSGAGGKAIIGGLEGVLGAFLDLIEVDAGWERAVESAAGASVGAMIVDGRKSARAALEALRREGGAGLVLPVGEGTTPTTTPPSGTRALRDLVRARSNAPAHVTRVLDALFSRAFVADDWESGIDVALANPELVIVTREGDRFATSGWRIASGRAVVTRSSVEEAERTASDAATAVAPLRERRKVADAAAVEARQRLNRAASNEAARQAEVGRLEGEDLRLRALLEQLVTSEETATSEVAALSEQIATIDEELLTLREELPILEESVATSQDRAERVAIARAELETLRETVGDEATQLSRREAQFAERRRLLEQRRSEIELRLEGRSSERAEAAGRRESLESDLLVLERLSALVTRAAEEIHVAQEAMDSTYREQLEATRAGAELLEEVRRTRKEAESRLGELGDVARKSEIEQAELVVMTANLHEMIRRDLGLEASDLTTVTHVELPEGVTIEQRVADLEARITSLGPINPLALDELATLEERYKELDAQVSDVRHARRELQEVIRALDQEIMQTFSSAVADVNEHFSALIAMLFPGGQGRLILTEPDDPLNTGVEIEVRPLGRNVRRLSLLSGGERSMAALAFLFAVFRSRPSPFYMMDEVEAALDDVNLQRFLSLVDEFRDEAQLLIVTHQKRTMEAADALYGVTMGPGASSKVISQRATRPKAVEPA